MTKELEAGQGFVIPEEILNLFDKSRAANNARNYCIHFLWGTKKAIQFATIGEQANREAWELIHKVYPNLTAGNLTYPGIGNKIFIREKV